HHYAPIRYYPRPYPVYYYPYPAGHSFWSGYFWGVTTAFVVGWHSHHLHAHHHLHVGHPYYRHRYYDPFYVRRSISINIVNVDRDVYVWQPRQHRIGVRPGRVTVTREGVVRADYGSRRYVRRGDESRRTVATSERRAVTSSGRTIGAVASGERRSTASGERRSTASGQRGSTASGERRSTAAASERDARVTARPSTRSTAAASTSREARRGDGGGSTAAGASSRSATSRSSGTESSSRTIGSLRAEPGTSRSVESTRRSASSS